MDVVDDVEYVEMLVILFEGFVWWNFNLYIDIDWELLEFVVMDNDFWWIFLVIDLLGCYFWY